jgi:gluconokinase
MATAMKAKVILLMGVSGSGKTTIGELLASRLSWPYADADSFHSKANVDKMATGHPLNDDDRKPWLESIRAWIDERIAKDEYAVVSCSALKKRYRDVLRAPGLAVVYLRGTREQIEPRLSGRKGHYFKPELLASQFAALEEPTPDEHVITVPIGPTPGEIVDSIIAATGVGQ